MRFIPLASSSHGNAYLVDDGETRLLLECGVSFKKLQQLSGYNLSRIAACLVTHEHGDHAKCFMKVIKCGIPVYATVGTRDALDCTLLDLIKKDEGSGQYLPLHFGSYDVLPFPTLHDAEEPVGFLVRSQRDGEKLVFATDTVNLGYQFPGVTTAAIECNHDDDIVARIDQLPERLAKHLRRASNTHMSVSRTCRWLAQLDKSQLRDVYLLHLSDSFSNEWKFRQAVERTVGQTIRVTVCPKEQTM